MKSNGIKRRLDNAAEAVKRAEAEKMAGFAFAVRWDDGPTYLVRLPDVPEVDYRNYLREEDAIADGLPVVDPDELPYTVIVTNWRTDWRGT